MKIKVISTQGKTTLQPRVHRHKEYSGGGGLQALVGLMAIAGLALSGFIPAVGRTNADRQESRRPNIVILLADDLGYGDFDIYGNPTIRTPNLDRMAHEGMKFTQFYAAAPICTPSRAGLLTGRLPIRTGVASNQVGVFFPDSKYGLPQKEMTIAEALKKQGYATKAIGKWHLGHRAQYLPINQGFDSWYGLPYSNDMDRDEKAIEKAARKLEANGRHVLTQWSHHEYAIEFQHPKIEYFNVPLMRGARIVERPANQKTLARRYTREATTYIECHRNKPFFLYLAYSSPHVPLFRSQRFAGVSRRGRYGDVVQEIDWSVGKVLQALRKTGQAQNTLVLLTSDNGPWLTFGEQGGSAGLLRNGKGTTWDGGVRVPMIAWWPGRIEPRSVTPAVTSALDIFATAVKLAGGSLPSDRTIDGHSMLPVLKGKDRRGDKLLFFYKGRRLQAVRIGPWKVSFMTQAHWGAKSVKHNPPLVTNLEHDPSERHNVAGGHPEVIKKAQQAVKTLLAGMKPTKDLLAARNEKYLTDPRSVHRAGAAPLRACRAEAASSTTR
jgi:arylsulfatase A-like enzyme